MTRIKIENFGPINKGYSLDNGWMEIRKNTFLIGDQGSGKSTVAKLFSMLTWIEKALNRGDVSLDKLTVDKFIEFSRFQKIQNYFRKDSYIAYEGDKFLIEYNHKEGSLKIEELENKDYVVPKIMYIPSERNFLSTVSNAYNLKGLPENIFTFAEELKLAQESLKGKSVSLCIDSYNYEYDENEESSYVVGKDYKLNLLEASSGLQSYTPLYLVSKNLSEVIEYGDVKDNISVNEKFRLQQEIGDILSDSNLSEEEKSKAMSKATARYVNKCFINVVEEPEQNLFPASQWELQKNLFRFNNRNEHNKLFITTHSPYLINYLPIAVKAYNLFSRIKDEDVQLKLKEIIPYNTSINPDDLVVYELDKIDGSINKLDDYNGLPSDENYLNSSLDKSNDLFVELLEFEEKWL